MKIVPLFTSGYSFKSILTVESNPKKMREGGADSIIQIAKEYKINPVFLVEDNMAAFLEAKKSAGKDVSLFYGCRISFCSDVTVEFSATEDSLCKYVIFANNEKGYYKLIEIFTKAGVDCSHEGMPRMDFKTLRPMWDDECLTLAVPFYDSFIHRNSCYFANCIPDFSFCNPVFFWEDNLLYFDEVIQDGINVFTENGKKYEIVKAKSIYYENREDFLSWQTLRCIQNRGRDVSTLEKPNLEHCASREFCVESWLEQERKAQ